MKKKHSNKKNRSLDEGDGPSSPKEKIIRNSPKRNKMDTPSVIPNKELDQERFIASDIVGVEYISNQITIESNIPSPTSNVETRDRLEYIDSQRSNRYSAAICPPILYMNLWTET